MKQKKFHIKYLVLVCVCIVIWIPVAAIVVNSLMGPQELQEAYGGVLGGGSQPVDAKLFPDFPTLQPFVELLLDSPDFFVKFWNSVRQVFPVLIGQILVGMPAAWAFARFRFPGRRVLFYLYMILMVMPFQVMMVSNYLVLSKLSLMDTHLAIILPGIFATLPVFLMQKFFRSIPEALMEAARIDGAGTMQIFLRIGIPLGIPGVISSLILNFLEYWNAIEQPMIFLKTKSKLPLSLYLPDITTDQMSVCFVASLVMLVPPIMLFLWGQEYLEQGIVASGLKE